jgi:hypothetical protein
VFWIVDNGSSHCGWTAAAEQPTAFETRSHQAMRPFDRRCNRDDLDLDRIAA